MLHWPRRGVSLSLWSIISSIVIIVGLFQPWLWRGYNPYSEFNPEAKKPEIHYHIVTTVSPFYTSFIKDGVRETTKWFMSPVASLSGFALISAAILSIFRFDNAWINVIGPLAAFSSSIIFLMSLGGGGLGLGSVTHLGWGFKITSIGIILNFLLSLMKIVSK